MHEPGSLGHHGTYIAIYWYALLLSGYSYTYNIRTKCSAELIKFPYQQDCSVDCYIRVFRAYSYWLIFGGALPLPLDSYVNKEIVTHEFFKIKL